MPSRCAECILCNLRHGTKCKVTGETYYNGKYYARGGYDGKPDWCPLVEVPTPHGRLIDADALLEDVRKNSVSYSADDFAHEWVDVQPTVIGAEEGDAE